MDYQQEWGYTVNKVRDIIAKKKWTIERLSHAIKMDNANLSRILSGVQTNMEYRTLFKIAEALEVKMSDLVR